MFAYKKEGRETMKKIFFISSAAIIILAATAFLLIYQSHAEVMEKTNDCYDMGGLPKMEKSGFMEKHFECKVETE